MKVNLVGGQRGGKMTSRIAQLEVKRVRLHEYIIMKLDERDYHGVADAAMDLRELEVEMKLRVEEYEIQKATSTSLPAAYDYASIPKKENKDSH